MWLASSLRLLATFLDFLEVYSVRLTLAFPYGYIFSHHNKTCIMKNIFLGLLVTLLLMGLNNEAGAQYQVVKEVDGVVFSTRWVKEKWFKRNSPKVLSVRVQNKNSHAVKYTLGAEIFKNTVLLESFPEEEYELAAGKKVTGRLNGIMFKPTKLSNEEIEKGDFDLELSGLEVTKKE